MRTLEACVDFLRGVDESSRDLRRGINTRTELISHRDARLQYAHDESADLKMWEEQDRRVSSTVEGENEVPAWHSEVQIGSFD